MELKHCGLTVCPTSANLLSRINSVTNSQVLTCGKEDNMFKGAVRYPESRGGRSPSGLLALGNAVAQTRCLGD